MVRLEKEAFIFFFVGPVLDGAGITNAPTKLGRLYYFPPHDWEYQIPFSVGVREIWKEAVAQMAFFAVCFLDLALLGPRVCSYIWYLDGFKG